MYEKGLGVPRDYDKAKYWREKADAQKKEEAEQILERPCKIFCVNG